MFVFWSLRGHPWACSVGLAPKAWRRKRQGGQFHLRMWKNFLALGRDELPTRKLTRWVAAPWCLQRG